MQRFEAEVDILIKIASRFHTTYYRTWKINQPQTKACVPSETNQHHVQKSYQTPTLVKQASSTHTSSDQHTNGAYIKHG